MDKRTVKLWICLFAFVFIVGFIAGAFIQKNQRISEVIAEYSNNFIYGRLNGQALNLFMQSLSAGLAFFGLLLIFSFGKVCLIPRFFLVLLYGLGKGAIASNVVCDSGVRGSFFSLTVLIPGLIVCACGLIVYSAQVTECEFSKNNSFRFKQRVYALFIYLFCIFFSAGLDVTFAELFKALS